jgi:hypothetical protein
MLWRGAAGDVGPSEIDWRLIVEVNERGEHVAIVVYDPEDIDAAYAELDARFMDVAARESSDPDVAAVTTPVADPVVPVAESSTPMLRIPSNAAIRLLNRIHERGTPGRTDGLLALVTEDFRFDDRKKEALENYRVTEVDAAGKLCAIVLFDADDRAAAHEELFERYVAMGADGMPQSSIEWLRGVNAHDLVRARGAMADDFVLDDYRRTGMGRLEGADTYIDALVALYELIPDARMDSLYTVAAERHGRVMVARTWGHNREGGEVESLRVVLVHHIGEKKRNVPLSAVINDALRAALAPRRQEASQFSMPTYGDARRRMRLTPAEVSEALEDDDVRSLR